MRGPALTLRYGLLPGFPFDLQLNRIHLISFSLPPIPVFMGWLQAALKPGFTHLGLIPKPNPTDSWLDSPLDGWKWWTINQWGSFPLWLLFCALLLLFSFFFFLCFFSFFFSEGNLIGCSPQYKVLHILSMWKNPIPHFQPIWVLKHPNFLDVGCWLFSLK